MSANHHNVAPRGAVARLLSLAVLFLSALWVAPAAFAVDSGDIVVVSSKGDVHVTMNGAARSVRAGTVLELPASIRTGRDGAIELKQGATTVSVGPETQLELPALEKRGAPIDRIVQPRGNAFYNIGKRESRKLRVETPYLVGVVKGTQFNVAAQEGATTISLFEGLLEIRAADESAVVDIKAGEIASRRHGDTSITVVKMEAGKTPTAAPRTSSNGADVPASKDQTPGRIELVDRGGGVSSVVSTVNDTVRGTGTPGNVSVDVRTPAGSAAGEAGVSLSAGNANINVGVPGAVDAGANGSVSVDNGSTSADVSTNVNVAASPATVDADTRTSVDVSTPGVSADVDVSTRVDAGAVSTTMDTGTAVDLSAVGVTAEVSTGATIDAGPVSAAVDTGATADLTSGTVSTGVDTSAVVGSINVPVAASTAVDISTGAADLSVSVTGADLGASVDLGQGNTQSTDTASPTTPATDTGTTVLTDVTGLLNGLVRRPGGR